MANATQQQFVAPWPPCELAVDFPPHIRLMVSVIKMRKHDTPGAGQKKGSTIDMVQ
jgi:hypothetical protein